ncbi:MAG: folate family ECF transporter S component [Oscillospiraceae bacterium]
MKSFFSMFGASARELKKIRCLTVTALLCAASVVIEMNSLYLNGGTVKVNFAFIALAAVGMLFGPVVGMVAGVVCDMVGFLSSTGGEAFNPVYPLVAALQGLIYGMVLYHAAYGKKYDLILRRKANGKETDIALYLRTVIARLIDVAVINLFINTAIIMYTKGITMNGFWAFFTPRLIKNVVELAVDLPLLFLLLPVVLTAYKRVFRSALQSA